MLKKEVILGMAELVPLKIYLVHFDCYVAQASELFLEETALHIEKTKLSFVHPCIVV